MKEQKPFVIHEDNHLLVVFKPAGWLSQGDETGDPCIVDWGKEYLKKKYDKPGAVFLGLPHRLDRPVSGVMVLARTSKSLERLNKMFREDKVQKTYVALCSNKPPREQDVLVHWLIKDSRKNRTTAYNKNKGGAKQSELSYELVGRKKTESLIRVFPKTGRPHQIRVQLAAIKCPIIGDLKYGGLQTEYKQSIALHAEQIIFTHPVIKNTVTYKIPLEHNLILSDWIKK